MDWADKLVAKKQARGDTHTTAHNLRLQVAYLCRSNSKRENLTDIKEEWQRLVNLRIEEDDREELEFKYEQEGYEIEASYQPGKVESVKLPFTSEEWADLLNAEGEFLPSCCATISNIRDILQEACRNDHFIKMRDLCEVALMAQNHDFKADENHPIGAIIRLWKKFEPVADEHFEQYSDGDLSDPQEALSLLADAANVIEWNQLHNTTSSGKDYLFNCLVQYNNSLATVRAAVHTLYHKMSELEKTPTEGYGVATEKGEMGYNRNGICVYRSKELAEEIAKRMTKDRKKWKEPKQFGVRMVRVSMKHGVEFLPDDHQIQEPEEVTKIVERQGNWDEID